jgi:hypothetical protein
MKAMDSVIRIGRGRLPGPPVNPLGLALDVYLEGGMTEAEALCALHACLLSRADTLGVRLGGDEE